MIHYNGTKLGELVIRQNGKRFKIEIRQGNCLAVFVHIRKLKEGDEGYKRGMYRHTLYMFFGDETHLKRCCKEMKGDLFGDEVVSVKLNIYYKESMTLLKYMARCGYRTEAYYKKPTDKKKNN